MDTIEKTCHICGLEVQSTLERCDICRNFFCLDCGFRSCVDFKLKCDRCQEGIMLSVADITDD